MLLFLSVNDVYNVVNAYLNDAATVDRPPRHAKSLPMPHERYHHGDLRRALLDAAMALIEENGGPHGWSLREAARRAGVSPGAPYRHFEDKQALLVALGVEGLERLNALCAEEAAAREADPLSQFRAMGIATVRFAAHNPVHYRVMNLPEVLKALKPQLQPAQDRVDAMVDAAVAQPGVRLDDAALLSLAGQAMVYGIARMFVDGHFAAMGVGPEQAEPLAARLTEILGTGFFASGAAQTTAVQAGLAEGEPDPTRQQPDHQSVNSVKSVGPGEDLSYDPDAL